LQGKWKESIPDTGTFIWTSVEDLAFAHVRAVEVGEEAANQRFFITAGYFTNREIADIVANHFPQYADRLPTPKTPGGGYPGGKVESLYKYDNSKSIKVLGLEYRSLEGEIVELVKSLQAIGI
jgi:nucleoside-diphosphate-sugar epimerase